MSPRLLLAVALAGAAGALARAGLGAALPGTVLATLLANLSGCLLLGLLVARTPAGSSRRAVLGPGLLGGWTTWSALAVETAGRLDGATAGSLVVSLLGGVALARLGLRLGAR